MKYLLIFICFSLFAAPPAPSGLASVVPITTNPPVIPSTYSIELVWCPTTNTTGYVLKQYSPYRFLNTNSKWTNYTVVSNFVTATNIITINNLVDGIPYRFRIFASNAGSLSPCNSGLGYRRIKTITSNEINEVLIVH